MSQLSLERPEVLGARERGERHREVLARWPRLWPEREEPNAYQAARLCESIRKYGRGVVLLAVLIEDGAA